jgi:hypothetical protein
MSNAHSGLVQGIPTFGGRVHPPPRSVTAPAWLRSGRYCPNCREPSGLLPTRRGHLGACRTGVVLLLRSISLVGSIR